MCPQFEENVLLPPISSLHSSHIASHSLENHTTYHDFFVVYEYEYTDKVDSHIIVVTCAQMPRCSEKDKNTVSKICDIDKFNIVLDLPDEYDMHKVFYYNLKNKEPVIIDNDVVYDFFYLLDIEHEFYTNVIITQYKSTVSLMYTHAHIIGV